MNLTCKAKAKAKDLVNLSITTTIVVVIIICLSQFNVKQSYSTLSRTAVLTLNIDS